MNVVNKEAVVNPGFPLQGLHTLKVEHQPILGQIFPKTIGPRGWDR